jgi:hypothetical protein
MPNGLPSKLDGWKEIAAYLGRDVTTAIRWEHERELPVHRVPGGKRGAVYAYRDEIDRWLDGDGHRPTGAVGKGGAPEPVTDAAVGIEPPLDRSVSHRDGVLPNGGFKVPQAPGAPRAPRGRALALVAVAAIALAAGVAVTLLGVRLTGDSAVPERLDRIEYRSHEIVARSASGTALWSYPLPGRHSPVGGDEPSNPSYARHVIADVDGDGDPEALVGVRLALPENTADELMCFNSGGELRWRSRLADEFTFRAGSYGPPWHDGRVVVYRTEAGVRIAWSQNHLTWWPAVLVTLDASGRRLSTFVHSGSIRAMTLLEGAEGPLILAAGVSNSQRAASLAVIDGRHPGGRSPEPPGSDYECPGCEPTPPARYFTFPPSELNAVVGLPYNSVTGLSVRGDRVILQTAEADGDFGFAGLVFEMSPQFELLRASSADSFGVHDRMRAAGRLDHAAAGCPLYRTPPRSREWTSGAGWRELEPVAGQVKDQPPRDQAPRANGP